MSDHYGVIAFREAVRGVRQDHGSHAFNNQKCVQEMAISGTEVLAGAGCHVEPPWQEASTRNPRRPPPTAGHVAKATLT